MIITSIENARNGDWIKGEYKGHPFEGAAWTHKDDLHVGNTRVHWDGGGVPEGVKIESIERPNPPLPTEPRSMISDVVLTDGFDYPLAVRDNSEKYPWGVFTAEGGLSRYVSDRDIVSFTLAKVVPA